MLFFYMDGILGAVSWSFDS